MSIDRTKFCGSNCSPLSKTATTTCASLLRELQEIWDEIGEGDTERDEMLLELEQECLDIYRRKVERSRKNKAELRQCLAESEAEIAQIASALGERVSVPPYEKVSCNLKQQISVIRPVLEDLRLKKQERIKEISGIEYLIAGISAEIAGNDLNLGSDVIQVDELDLTTKKLGNLMTHLQELQYEKNLRLQKVNSHISAIHGLSVVMSLDFTKIMAEVHPSFDDAVAGQSKSISNETLARLTSKINSLKQEKQQRLLKVQDLGRTLVELWSLLDMPLDEQRKFDHVTRLITSNADEILGPGSLSIDIIEQPEAEVERLNVLKVSKLKEIIFRRQSELEEICKAVHMDVDSDQARQILISLMESGSIDLSDLLSNMDDQVANAKEQARSRKDILEKVEKWRQASEEESWLEEYERDENRYSAGRGVHKNLKRAEKARSLVSKIPSLVESLTAKVKAWELEKGMPFLYNKTPLLRTLEEFTVSRQEKEEEKRKSREQKKLQDQLAAEQEAMFGSKPNVKKPLGQSTFANTMVGTPNSRRTGTPWTRPGKDRRESGRVGTVIPINYVALQKEDR
ncbi:65-kda microtubule-associated protein 5 [Phtheirospermum japonicum]|uniref:65-kDa microtubule-associated protein 5 n=1 Tax=Phtheirospermum japonicum TaxID=374723 RepID=A0A830C4D1_9LAMI|nr:65-kda microtubule-associated protein 5 [Phtheirospermum japonicum]